MSKVFSVVFFWVLIGPLHLSAEEPAPLVAAKAAFETARDDVHRQKVRLEWDADVQPIPKDLEVLVLRGYLNHDLLLMQRHDDQVTVSLVTVDRQWFYHPKSNARSFATVAMSANAATELWQSIQAIIRVQATEIVEVDRDDGSARGGSSSHESNHLLTWRMTPNGPWEALPVLRGSTYHQGIRDLNQLRMTAISALVWARFPKETWVADPDAKTADRWRAWWRSRVPFLKGDGVAEVDQRANLLVDDACEMLGDLGDATDAALLTDFAHGLRPAQPRTRGAMTAPTFYEDALRTAIAQSTQRIALRLRWDTNEAITSIHANRRITYTGNDQERWLRQQFHQRDPERYVTLLREDLTIDKPDLVVTSIAELAKLYPGRYREDLQRLLQHKEPTVVLQAAVAVLGIEVVHYVRSARADFTAICNRSKEDPLLRDALAALEHLAGDPTVPIAPGTYWFTSNPRTSASEVLGACPLPWGWDEERHRRQLARIDEVDGRFIGHLLRRLQFPLVSGYQPDSRKPTAIELALLLPTWRRALVTPITRGTVLAMEELIALRDSESLPRLCELRNLLRAGATPQPVGFDDDQSPLPWISRYEVDDLEKRLKALSDSQSVP